MHGVKLGLADFYSPDVADRFTFPVLLIQGSEDKVNPLDKNAALLIKALPQGRLEVLDGYGHLPEVEAPDIVNRMLMQFFAD
jgi:pimeloyl-ACP methyl ester carboxylesterase